MDSNTQKPAESDELETGAGGDSPEAPALPEPVPATTSDTPSPSDSPAETTLEPSGGDKRSIPNFLFGNKYLVIFVMLLAVAGGGIFFVVQTSKNEAPVIRKTTSLTADELTALRGNTTVVGDSQTVLDVQSNAVFQGQVILRNNLEVAGTVKIGTPLSLPALTVSGTSTLGQIAGNGLSITGNSALQGDVNLQRNLSVAGGANFAGAVAVQQLSVTNLVLAGDLLLPRHLSATGGIPGKALGSALGPDGTASVSGTDVAGSITFNTGTGTLPGNLITLTFAQKYTRTPHVVVTPVGSGGANLNFYVLNRTASGFTLSSTNAPPINSNFTFDYIVID